MENNEFNEFNELNKEVFDYELVAAANEQEQRARQGKGLATASMVLGIISLVWLVVTFGFGNLFTILPLIGLILGIVFAVSRKDIPEIRKAATPGIVMNSICLGLGIIGWIVIIGVISTIDMSEFDAIMQEQMQVIYDTDKNMYDVMYQAYYELFPGWFEGIGSFFMSFFK